MSDHPFASALVRALESFLEPHIGKLREEREAAAKEAGFTEETVRRLHSLGKIVGRFFEEEEEALGEGDGGVPTTGLEIIPTAQVVEPGAVARFTVRLRPGARSWPQTAPTATVSLISGSAAVAPDEMELKDRGGYFSRSFAVANLPEGEMCEVEVRVGDSAGNCLLECRRGEAPDPVNSLQFEHSTYRIEDGGTRSVAVLAPWELVAGAGASLRVSIAGEPSITLEGEEPDFVYDYARQCGRGRAVVHGRGVGSRARITAELAKQVAVAELEVGISGSGDVKFDFTDKLLPQRALWEGSTLKISVADKSVSRYVGSYPELPGQNEVHFRTMLAELVAFHSVRRVVEGRRKGTLADVLAVYRDHMQRERKLLPRVHSALVAHTERGVRQPAEPI